MLQNSNYLNSDLPYTEQGGVIAPQVEYKPIKTLFVPYNVHECLTFQNITPYDLVDIINKENVTPYNDNPNLPYLDISYLNIESDSELIKYLSRNDIKDFHNINKYFNYVFLKYGNIDSKVLDTLQSYNNKIESINMSDYNSEVFDKATQLECGFTFVSLGSVIYVIVNDVFFNNLNLPINVLKINFYNNLFYYLFNSYEDVRVFKSQLFKRTSNLYTTCFI